MLIMVNLVLEQTKSVSTASKNVAKYARHDKVIEQT